MPPPRTGSVEPFKRADGTTYYRARIRHLDGFRERVDVPEKHCTPAGGLTGREPELIPLLKVMRAEAKGKGRLLSIDSTDRKLSRQLQRCLKIAKVDRADITTSDATRKAMTFHDLRATGITWCAVRGDDPLKIKQRAGHSTFSTTEGYIREAENLREGFGQVFPPLPASLRKSIGPRVQGLGQVRDGNRNLTRKMVEAPGIEVSAGRGDCRHLPAEAGFRIGRLTLQKIRGFQDPPQAIARVKKAPRRSAQAGPMVEIFLVWSSQPAVTRRFERACSMAGAVRSRATSRRPWPLSGAVQPSLMGS